MDGLTRFTAAQDYMPFSDVYNSTFKNDVEYNQLLMQTAMALQTNKFIQVGQYKNKLFLFFLVNRFDVLMFFFLC